VQLWTERGFEQGIEETTVEEIARAAGYTKGTFYFHFAHKEDVLLDLGWGTAESMHEEVTAGLAAGRSTDAILDTVLGSLARRVQRTPRAVLARMFTEFARFPNPRLAPDDGHVTFEQSFAILFASARERGDLPTGVDTDDVAQMLGALIVNAIESWVGGRPAELARVLRSRADILLAGVRHAARA